MIKTVLFDLDYTLYDEKLYLIEVFKKFASKNDIDISNISDLLNDEILFHSKDIFGDILKKIDLYNDTNQNELFDIYKSLDYSLKLYNDANEILSFLKNKKIETAIVTNGVIKAQKNKVKCLGLSQKINHIVYARKFGKDCEKPHQKPFLEALKLTESEPKHTIFIGDNPKTDIKGANDLNITSILLNKGYSAFYKTPRANFNISNLLELKDILRKLS